jgi:ABC-type oligopeptide transport system substrate-binding subunit
MKKFLFVLIALLTVFAFATGAVAAEKKATAPQAGKVTGAVTAYIAANQADKSAGTISVKDAKGKNWAFDVLPDTKIKGEVTKGATATVAYKKEGGKTSATSITVIAVKKPAAPKTK